MDFLAPVYEWMHELAAAPSAPFWLFLLAFAESSFFPIPPDIMLIWMGMNRPDLALLYALLCTAGSVLGGGLGYGIGYYGGRPVAIRMFKEHRVLHAEEIYRKYDIWAIGAAGFTPIPYKVFTIFSGVMESRFWMFMFVSLLSRGSRFFIVGGLMFFFGETVKVYLDKHLNWVTLGIFVLLVLGFIVAGFMGRKHKNVTPPPPEGVESS